MPEEVRIVAILDTTDIDNGVKRAEKAAREMKQVWETSMNIVVAAPYDLASRTNEQLRANLPALKTIGEESGDSFFGGFFGRMLSAMLVRDLIKGFITTMQEAVSEFAGNDERLSGGAVNKGGFHPFKSLGQWIGDALTMGERALLPGLGDMDNAGAASAQGSISANSLRDKQLERLKEDPTLLKTPTASLEGQLADLIEKRSAASERNAFVQRTEQSGVEARRSEEEFKLRDKDMADQEKRARELLQIARERDRQSAEEDKKSYGTGYGATKSEETAADFMRGQERDEEARRQKEAQRQADEENRKALEAQDDIYRAKIASDRKNDESAEKRTDRDLKFSEKQLDHLKATSVVSIGGSLYGKNDSAIQLVNHAARQVSLLQSINAELKQLGDKMAQGGTMM
jgi:hypothetical protein